MRSYRKLWSATPGITGSLSTFGVFALPQSGDLVGSKIGTMRWYQTGRCGYLPNTLMKGESLYIPILEVKSIT